MHQNLQPDLQQSRDNTHKLDTIASVLDSMLYSPKIKVR